MNVNSSKDVHYPLDYIMLLRDCLVHHEEKTFDVREIKAGSGTINDTSTQRFSCLVNALRRVPPIELSIAKDIALIADYIRGNLLPIVINEWAGDARSHFEISSSGGTKGRILTTVINLMRSEQCLELGTAYGMSALFILEALKIRGTDTHLTTLEGSEPQFSISSEILKTRYGNQVSCEFGWTQEALPGIVQSLGPLDFLFHDAGHSRNDYVRDFYTVLPILAPGSVVLIDDIHWEDSRFFRGTPRCYEGWTEVIADPRVRRAVEIDDSMGLLLLGEQGETG